jgi:hypothetical protein
VRSRLKTGDEEIEELTAALAAEEDRKRGGRIPKRCALINWLFYRDMVRFADQVRRYFVVFGRERVRVIIYDDFKADTPGSFRDTLRFLDVDPDFAPDSFEIVNPSAVVRSPLFRSLLRHPRVRFTLGRALLPSKWLRRRLGERLHRLNERRAAKSPMDVSLRRELQAELAPEVERLSDLLERDLSFWSRVGAEAVP